MWTWLASTTRSGPLPGTTREADRGEFLHDQTDVLGSFSFRSELDSTGTRTSQSVSSSIRQRTRSENYSWHTASGNNGFSSYSESYESFMRLEPTQVSASFFSSYQTGPSFASVSTSTSSAITSFWSVTHVAGTMSVSYSEFSGSILLHTFSQSYVSWATFSANTWGTTTEFDATVSGNSTTFVAISYFASSSVPFSTFTTSTNFGGPNVPNSVHMARPTQNTTTATTVQTITGSSWNSTLSSFQQTTSTSSSITSQFGGSYTLKYTTAILAGSAYPSDTTTTVLLARAGWGNLLVSSSSDGLVTVTSWTPEQFTFSTSITDVSALVFTTLTSTTMTFGATVQNVTSMTRAPAFSVIRALSQAPQTVNITRILSSVSTAFGAQTTITSSTSASSVFHHLLPVGRTTTLAVSHTVTMPIGSTAVTLTSSRASTISFLSTDTVPLSTVQLSNTTSLASHTIVRVFHARSSLVDNGSPLAAYAVPTNELRRFDGVTGSVMDFQTSSGTLIMPTLIRGGNQLSVFLPTNTTYVATGTQPQGTYIQQSSSNSFTVTRLSTSLSSTSTVTVTQTASNVLPTTTRVPSTARSGVFDSSYGGIAGASESALHVQPFFPMKMTLQGISGSTVTTTNEVPEGTSAAVAVNASFVCFGSVDFPQALSYSTITS